MQTLFGTEGNCTEPAGVKAIHSVAANLFDDIHNSICPRITLESMLRRGTLVSSQEECK